MDSSQGYLRPLVLMSSNAISTPERWFACARVLDPYLTNPNGFALTPDAHDNGLQPMPLGAV